LRPDLPKIYPITDRDISGLSHLEQVRRLVEGGAKLIQLRDKTADAGDFYRDVVETISFARPRGVRLIVNDRVDIAVAAAADGVHIGQDDLPAEQARKLLGGDAMIGLSTHAVEQARAAIHLPVDYIAIGPIFETSTKGAADKVVGLAGLRSVREAVGEFPLVAIGGIDRTNALSVLEAGADSVAVISDLLSDPEDIVARMRSFDDI
jgi:thiamine-phosphate pyrophosphorylase